MDIEILRNQIAISSVLGEIEKCSVQFASTTAYKNKKTKPNFHERKKKLKRKAK